MGALDLAHGLIELFIQRCKEVPTTFVILLAVSTLLGFLSIVSEHISLHVLVSYDSLLNPSSH